MSDSSSDSSTVVSRLAELQATLARLEKRYERPAGSVALLAVSKTKPLNMIRAAAQAGQLEFGENYAEEGAKKRQMLVDQQLVWHYIGGIQSNKTSLIANSYDWVQSVDRLKIARRLSDQRSTELPQLNVCLQVNIDDESAKSGCAPAEASELARQIAEQKNLCLRGVMAIPVASTDFARQRESCKKLHEIFADLRQHHTQIDTMSVGMSADMEAAVAEGSTMVRIGTALFGQRNYPPGT